VPAEIELRRLTTEDLSAANDLRQAAGWNQTLTDWRRLLALDPDGCFVAVKEGRVVGTVTNTSFGLELAWIGMALVDPSQRSQGIGRKLLVKSIEYLQEKKLHCIKLDATPAGQVLYEKLGFQIEWPLARWMKTEVTVHQAVPNAYAVQSVKETDWNEVLQLDLHAFGVSRESLLRQLGKDSAESVVCRGADGAMEGFGFLRTGINADYIGPIVARSEDVGKSITQHLLKTSQRPIFWDIPGPCTAASTWATKLGFVSQRPLLRMFMGENDTPGDPQQTWGISDPATG